MAWMQCRSCSAKFAIGLLRCPQCQAVSELYAVPEEVIEAEQEANMPKITVAAGASNALGAPEEAVADVAQEAPVTTDPEPAVQQEEAQPTDADQEAEPEGTASGSAVEEDLASELAAEETTPPAPKKRASRKPAPSV